jgi:uncharacterized protein YceK
MIVVCLMVLCVSGCGSSSNSSTATPGFPPKTEADLHTMAKSSKTTLSVVGHDQSSAQPVTAVLFVLVPHGLTQGQQAAALLKVLYDKGLDTKIGHQLGSAVVLGYWKGSQVGDKFTAGRAELDAAGKGRTTAILDVIQGAQKHEWRVAY